MNLVKPADFPPAHAANFRYAGKCNPQASNLRSLTGGVYGPTGKTAVVSWHTQEESLLFC